ncbi:MAG TPA: DegT/DnrJ/EryC1/StrS family aminotransferase, partial [Chryseolinea sp.]|nr:DegT/DnrJ/EryC1/StrS family aminotransferase [Chryseolinea sp.]
IQTMIHYPIPPHLQKAYEGLGYRKGSYPITERLATEVLSLPMWVGMSEGQVQRVCEEVKAYF